MLAGTAGPQWLQILTTSRHFRFSPFDVLAAIECAEMGKTRLGARMSQATKAKAKFDEQIVAIGRIERAEVIYSDDSDIRGLVGADDGVRVMGMADMQLPPFAAQGSFDLEAMAPSLAPPPPENE